MKLALAIALSVPLAAAVLGPVQDAHACGGCFVQQSENTQVTSHRMILSISTQSTTLWDQIVYTGSPSSFAWALPIRGQVTVGLSSDALFQNLDQLTQVTVRSPQIICPPCSTGFASSGSSVGAFSSGSSSSSGGGGVTVIAEEVVGPYETVQLMSTDPMALTNWLLMNGYNIPPDIAPVIAAYVNEGFNFLALKLVPGQGIDSMRPVRVTTPGASPVLPLRMVAAGTGATTPITLHIMGEGRYEPANFPSFLIREQDLVWNWDTSSSNYTALRAQGFTDSMGRGWLVEAAEPFSMWYLSNPLMYLAQYQPLDSGYADEMGMGAVQACQDDLDALFLGISVSSLWTTRLYGELSRAALGEDLDLQAEATQSIVPRDFQAYSTVGTPPACPCGGSGSGGWGSGSGSGSGGGGGSNDTSVSGGGCAMQGEAAVPVTFAAATTLMGLGLLRRRNRRPRAIR
jgi:uncharacterized membrane protein YgcG